MYLGSTLTLGAGYSVHTDDLVFSPELDYGVNTEFIKLFVCAYVKLLCDTPFGRDSKPLKRKRQFLSELTSRPVLDIIRSNARLYDELVSSLHQTGGESSIRPFLDGFKATPIFWEYHHWYQSDDPSLFTYISTFLLFGKKLAYVDESFNSTAFRGWIDVEQKLSQLTFSEHDLDSLSTIVSVVLGDVEVDHLLPRHGPGMVADRDIKDVVAKVTKLRIDKKLAYVFHRERPYWTAEMGFGASHAEEHISVQPLPSRIKFVPKDVTKSRTICMEPVGYMYYQQEVLRWLGQAMKRSYISRFVDMNDQGRNQHAALISSITGAGDTLDLSSASDSVSVDLVRGVFSKTPRLKLLLLATRSSAVETPDGAVRPVKKFAPMGSAVCFPTQCIIFTAVCLYSYMSVQKGLSTGAWTCSREDVLEMLQDNLQRGYSVAGAYTRRYLPPVVFGDDIIVDSRCTRDVVTTLSRLGFSINESKSFTGAQSFRESCGVFALAGEDVTPCRFRLPLIQKGKRWDASTFAAVIAAINNLRSYGYFSVASYLQSIIEGCGFRYRIPYTTDANIFGIVVRKKHPVPESDLRYNSDYQRTEERVLGVIPRRKSGRVSDHYAWNQWWRGRVRDISTLDLSRSSRPRPQETRLGPVWSRVEE